MGLSVVQNTKKERIIFHLEEFENPKGRRGQGGGRRRMREILLFFNESLLNLFQSSDTLDWWEGEVKDLSHCNPKLAAA